MKSLLIILFFVVCFASTSNSAVLVLGQNGSYVTKADLSTAATSADSAGKTIMVTSALSAVQSNISSASVHAWPSDRTLVVAKGGSINPTTKFIGLPVATPEMFGGYSDGTHASETTLAIQRAINASSVIKVSGAYAITPATNMTDEAGTNKAAFIMKSNMSIIAEPGTTFKITDNVSTDATPVRFSMFFSNSVLSNITFRNLIMDMNGANNKISPSRPSSYNHYTQAAIIFSGTPGGVAARADDVTIENCQFLNTAGVSCIVMAQSNTASVTLGKRWVLKNNLFKENGLDTDDHSSVFGWADDVLVDGNTFTHSTMLTSSNKVGGLVAYEIHGANQRFVNNKIDNYYQMVWVAPNLTSTVDNVVVANNNASPIGGVGIDFYRASASELAIKDIVIKGNTIVLDDTTQAISIANIPKTCIQISSAYLITDVLVEGNFCYKNGTANTASSLFMSATQTVAAQVHDKIVVRGNQALGTTFGAYITTNATNGYGSLFIENNVWSDLTPAGVYTAPAGVTVAATSAIKTFSVDGNRTIDNRATPLVQYGVYLNGVITELYVGANLARTATVTDYYENALTVTYRRGFYTRIVYNPVFAEGSAVTVGNGLATAFYSQSQKQITVNASLTVGSTTTFPGDGGLRITLPYAASTSTAQYLGTWRIWDSSAVLFYTGTAEIDSSGTVATLQINGGTYATGLSPITIAVNDIISVQITYGIP